MSVYPAKNCIALYHLRHFYHADMRTVRINNITDRVEQQKKLKCKSMTWYFDKVFSDSPFILDYLFLGKVLSN